MTRFKLPSRANTRLVFIASACIAHIFFASFRRSASANETRPAKNQVAETCARHAEAGERLKAQGKLFSAKEEFIACAQSSCPKVLQSDCIDWLKRVEEAMPTVLLRVVGAKGDDLPEAVAILDGKPFTLGSGLPIALDPGTHELRVDYRREQKRLSFLVFESDKKKPVQVQFGQAIADPTPPPQPRVSLFPAWVGIATAGVFAVTTGVFWVWGRSERGTLANGCAKTSNCPESDISSSRTKLIVGDIALGAAVVGGAFGLAWLLIHSGDKPVSKSSQAASIGAFQF
jgi:hypothetical protein